MINQLKNKRINKNNNNKLTKNKKILNNKKHKNYIKPIWNKMTRISNKIFKNL